MAQELRVRIYADFCEVPPTPTTYGWKLCHKVDEPLAASIGTWQLADNAEADARRMLRITGLSARIIREKDVPVRKKKEKP